MSSYQGSTSVDADAQTVFDFVSNPENLPKYVPCLTQASLGYGNVIRVEGDCPHGHFRGVGGFVVEPDNLRIHWDSRANLNYRGWMQVVDHGEHATLSIHLEFDPGLDRDSNVEFSHVLKDHPKTLQEALDQTLVLIKNACEGALVKT